MEPLLRQIETASQNLREELKKFSDDKEPKHPNIVGLRRLSYYCSKRILQSDNKEEKFLCFYISKFIDSIFSDLYGDAPYDKELQKSRISLISTIPEKFDKIIDSIKKNNKELLIPLCELVNDYIEAVNFLNKVKYP